MRASPFFLLLATLSSACLGKPQYLEVAAPAPASALDCAMRQLTTLGYTPLEGGVSDGYIRFVSVIPNSAGAAAAEAGTRLATFGMKGHTRAVQNVVTVIGAGGTLRLRGGTVYENEKSGEPSATVKADAEGVLAACATPSGGNRVSSPAPSP